MDGLRERLVGATKFRGMSSSRGHSLFFGEGVLLAHNEDWSDFVENTDVQFQKTKDKQKTPLEPLLDHHAARTGGCGRKW